MTALITALPLLFFILSIVLLRKWSKLIKYIILNLLVFAAYYALLFHTSVEFFKRDAFGIGQLLIFFVMIYIQSITCLVFAIIKNRKLKKSM